MGINRNTSISCSQLNLLNVYCAGEIGCTHSIVFEYQPARSGDHASTFLAGFTGHLVTDGYSGYEKVKNVTRCRCWAHVRRKNWLFSTSVKGAQASAMLYSIVTSAKINGEIVEQKLASIFAAIQMPSS